jgi:adenylosuccinate synthase
VGPRAIDHVLGIVKAYTTRVGAGPFPTELFDEMGEHLARVGHEFGSVTGRARRCGWFDAVALRRSIALNSVSGLCITKLDVLDAIDTIRICVGYEVEGKLVETPPLAADQYAEIEPVYEDVPGWKSSTVGLTRYEELPENARAYLDRLQDVVGVPIEIISTGPDRAETIVLRNPFD